jgi:three-Cys-motif partner protein
MTAHLIEQKSSAFEKLRQIPLRFPTLQIFPHKGDFIELASTIASKLSPRAFAFVFIDPTGWNVDLHAIAPLIRRDNCEVVFNFMFEFINRFAFSDDPSIRAQLDRLIPHRDWRSKICEIDQTAQNNTSQSITAAHKRKMVIITEFHEALKAVGRYKFVANLDVLRPVQDKTIYFLVYATRKPEGIAVFRDCQVKSLKEQSDMRGKTKITERQKQSGQLEIFSSQNQMGPDTSIVSLNNERHLARERLISMTQVPGPPMRWGDVWPNILSNYVITLSDLRKIANKERKAGKIDFIDWPKLKRIPEDNYLIKRGVIPRPTDGP